MGGVSEARPIFYFAAMSPYSWLAAERIGGVLPQARWQPLFAGGVFKAAGRKSWGLDEGREEGPREWGRPAQANGRAPLSWPPPGPTQHPPLAPPVIFPPPA